MNRKFRRKILEIKNVFAEKEIRNIASKTKFIQRESKFNSIKFLKLCVFSDDGLCKNSLSKLCTLIQKTEKTSICVCQQKSLAFGPLKVVHQSTPNFVI